ncbi:hypothetical protein D9M72_556770 [compost metagenome]
MCPQTVDCLQKRSLAASRFTDHQGPLSGKEIQFVSGQESLVIAGMHELDRLDRKSARGVLGLVLEHRGAAASIVILRLLHRFYCLGKLGDPVCIRPERRDVGHRMDEPRAFVDQSRRQLGAGDIVLQADRFVDVGE